MLRLRPTGPYGPQQVFSSVACAGSRVVAVGAASGGVHGNPRVSTWRLARDVLEEVPAPFERYGGPNAISVDRAAGGPLGFLIAGNRVAPTGRAGAAVWTSPTGEDFTVLDGDPALGSDSGALTSAYAATATAEGWVVVGGMLRSAAPSGARDPMAWSSSDGLRWTREEPSGSAAVDEVLQRAVGWPGAVVAVGPAGDAFGAWRRANGVWTAAGRFGRIAGTGVGEVTGLAVAGPRIWAAVADGTALRVYASTDARTWQDVVIPLSLPAVPDRRLIVAGGPDLLLLGADDGRRGRLWAAPTG